MVVDGRPDNVARGAWSLDGMQGPCRGALALSRAGEMGGPLVGWWAEDGGILRRQKGAVEQDSVRQTAGAPE